MYRSSHETAVQRDTMRGRPWIASALCQSVHGTLSRAGRVPERLGQI
jgi:hypothetical protein